MGGIVWKRFILIMQGGNPNTPINLLPLIRLVEISLLFAAFFLTNSSAFATIGQFPNFYEKSDPAWLVVGLCILFGLLTLLVVRHKSNELKLLVLLKKHFPLYLYILFCLISLTWSVFPLASVYELVLLLFSTLMGLYIAIRYKQKPILEIILFFAFFSVVISYILILIFPSIGRLENPVFLGAWRGLFWHRNHLGSLMALFSSLFILNASMERDHFARFLLNIVLFVLSAILVFGSRSATGILIFFVLIGVLLIAFLWQKNHDRFKLKHYITIGVCFIVILVFVLINLDFVFGLVNRDTTMTGRIPLWNDILSNHWLQKPIIGYGFGVFWNQESVRIMLQEQHNWRYPVWFGDNGFLDILLNTGIIGLTLFLTFYIISVIRSIKVFYFIPNQMTLYPLLIIIYIFFANISYSFLLEVDQFVWMLLIIAATLSLRMQESKKTP